MQLICSRQGQPSQQLSRVSSEHLAVLSRAVSLLTHRRVAYNRRESLKAAVLSLFASSPSLVNGELLPPAARATAHYVHTLSVCLWMCTRFSHPAVCCSRSQHWQRVHMRLVSTHRQSVLQRSLFFCPSPHQDHRLAIAGLRSVPEEHLNQDGLQHSRATTSWQRLA